MEELIAPAKLTTSLRITGVRDDGYHFIDAEMVALDLGDRLAVSEGDSLAIGGAYPMPATGDDLVRRALGLVGRSAAVIVDKSIPPGAGLGGGSADAAAILRWAGFDDVRQAAALGADVGFCLVGGRARVSGIGDVIEPLPFEPREFTLLIPPFGCSTPEVYRTWDQLGGPAGENGNDLEPAALHVAPALAEWRTRLGDATGETPRLAGSGSSWFVDGRHPGGERIVVSAVPAL